MIRRLLVLRGGALGDFIVTLPALRLLRERWPAAQIELAGNAVASELGIVSGLLQRVHSQHEQRWAALYDEGPLPAEFAAWLGALDLVVNYWPDPDGTLRRRFPVRAGQQFVCADALPSIAPAAAHYCAPLEKFGAIIDGRARTSTFAKPTGDRPLAAGNVLSPGAERSPRPTDFGSHLVLPDCVTSR